MITSCSPIRVYTKYTPGSECFLTEGAVTRSAVLVLYIPGYEGQMSIVSFGKRPGHSGGLGALDGRGITVVVPLSVKIPATVRRTSEHLGILARHPSGLGRRGCREDDLHTGAVEPLIGIPIASVPESSKPFLTHVHGSCVSLLMSAFSAFDFHVMAPPASILNEADSLISALEAPTKNSQSPSSQAQAFILTSQY